MGISTWKANTRAKNKNYMRSKRTDMTGLPNKVFLKVQSLNDQNIQTLAKSDAKQCEKTKMFESNQKLSHSGTTFLKRENKVLQIGNLPKAINSQFQSKCLAINNVMKSLYVLTVYSKFLNLQKWRFP